MQKGSKGEEVSLGDMLSNATPWGAFTCYFKRRGSLIVVSLGETTEASLGEDPNISYIQTGRRMPSGPNVVSN